jgi:NAD(P)H-hydrate epimerase
MIPVLTKAQAYKLDADTINSGHLNQEELMDNAGKAVAQFFCEKIDNPFNQKVVIVCGKGNNGGDGVIAHSYLKLYNVNSTIIFCEEKHRHSTLLKKYKISRNEYSIYNDKIKFDKYNWIIDGIFGIGLSRSINKKYQKIIKKINYNENTISIDIPSGVFVDGSSYTYGVEPKFTLAFGFSKLGHYLVPINNLFQLNIGFKSISTNAQKIEFSDINNILKFINKKSDVHKYSNGKCFIYGGIKYSGATILSTMACLKTGSSYVDLYYDDSYKMLDKIDMSIPEAVITSDILDQKDIKTPILIGPGDNKIDNISTYHIDKNDIIIDGGAIEKDLNIDYYPTYSILTPHMGEFKKFYGYKEVNYLDLNVLKSLQSEVQERIIVLKSFNTFIITKDMIYIMDKGPSLLATAGTGDVLSGILVSLLSQGYSRLEASILGTYLHAEAASYYMNNISKDGMTASDLIDCIPHAFNILRQYNEH